MLDFKGSSPASVKAALKLLWNRQLAAAAILGTAGTFLLTGDARTSWLGGMVWAVLDAAIVFGCTWYSAKHPPLARRLVAVMRVTRLALAVILVFGMLRLRLTVAPLLLGFILLHIIFIFNLLNFTRRKNQKDIRRP
ncbi:MAG: hypothetical protein I3I94_03740 [Acidaminococcaceae bacterium]|jgi:hypothetical protein|nr:hypothetical protein [Acidaminococcaceae bacterium]